MKIEFKFPLRIAKSDYGNEGYGYYITDDSGRDIVGVDIDGIFFPARGLEKLIRNGIASRLYSLRKIKSDLEELHRIKGNDDYYVEAEPFDEAEARKFHQKIIDCKTQKGGSGE